MDTIEIHDNFLEQEVFEEMKSQIMGDHFFWKYRNTVVYKDDPEEYFQFVHVFFNHCKQLSDKYELLTPLIEKMGVNALIRAKANLLIRTEEHVEHGLHVDYTYDCYSAIFYINTNNGYTLFSDGTKVNSLENRLVVFDSRIMHTGATCTDEKRRVVLNINFI
jgi:hypothetical protein